MLFTTSCGGDSQAPSVNPLLLEWDTPFGVPPFDEITAEHYLPAFNEAVNAHNREIESIVNDSAEPDFDNTIVAFDRSGMLLEKVMNVFSLISEAESSAELEAVEAELMPLHAAHNDEVMMNDKLFKRISEVYGRRESLGLDSIQMRLVEKSYKEFVRSGAALSQSDKARLKEINQELSLCVVKFGNNLLAENADYELVLDNDEQLLGLPVSARESAREKSIERGYGEDRWVFTTDKSSMIPLLTYSRIDTLREKLYKAYTGRCASGNGNDNREIINDMVRLRTEKAHLLGYDTFAELALDGVMAAKPANVYSLLDELWKPALERAKTELEEMKEIKIRETGNDTIRSWDWWFYANKLRKQKYNLDSDQLRPYFSLENVRAGVFSLANRLYGITFRPIRLPLYNKDCTAYEAIDRDGSHLGVLYLDLLQRDTKSPGAWCGDFVAQGYDADGERTAPVVSIVCNFPRPTDNLPSMLDIDQTTTLFHEFGHAIQSLFSDVKYKGLRYEERDFVELPSQIMENWALEPKMLRNYAIHYQTSMVLPDHFIERMQNSRLFNQGFETVELLAASYTDMDIHNLRDYEHFDVEEFEKSALAKRGLIPEIEPRYRYPYFNHIFGSSGYSAGYYSYIWAEVLDKDAFEAFVETGDIFDSRTAERFRQLLSAGDMVDGTELYRQFRGAEPSHIPLMRTRGLIDSDTVDTENIEADDMPFKPSGESIGMLPME